MKKRCYKEVLWLLLKNMPPEELLDNYILNNNENYNNLADFIGMNLKANLDWICISSVIDFMEKSYVDSVENGNLK